MQVVRKDKGCWKEIKGTEILEEIKVNRFSGRNKSGQSYLKE